MGSGTRVYTPGDQYAHELSFNGSPNCADKAMCGALPLWDMWHGTGDQDEYDTAEILPLCPACAAASYPDWVNASSNPEYERHLYDQMRAARS